MIYRLVPENELLNLLSDVAKLDCLVSNGVDNWDGYMTNKTEFIEDALSYNSTITKHSDDLSFKDIAKTDIQKYPVLNIDK